MAARPSIAGVTVACDPVACLRGGGPLERREASRDLAAVPRARKGRGDRRTWVALRRVPGTVDGGPRPVELAEPADGAVAVRVMEVGRAVRSYRQPGRLVSHW